MKIYLTLSVIAAIILVAIIITRPGNTTGNASEKSLAWFKKELASFVATAEELNSAASHLRENDSIVVFQVKMALKKCRLQYKRISFFMGYFFPDEARICNGPPVPEVEAAEFREPLGLQVIASLLYSDSPAIYRDDLVKQSDMLARTASSFYPLLNDFGVRDNDVIKSLNLELIRIITLYITGYDSPELKSGIEESHESMSTIETILLPYIKSASQKDSIENYLAAGKQYLKSHPDFDSFNRLLFITHFALPLEQQLNGLINESATGNSRVTPLNSHSTDLFAPGALDKKAFPHFEDETDTMVTNLGKQLFFETSLSGNATRSCGSCHSAGIFFTDGLVRNKAMDGTADLPRNTPGLLYAGYQYAQFWDGRAQSLEAQIDTVLRSKTEMSSSADTIIKRLTNDPVYLAEFKKTWASGPNVTFKHIAGALAAYIRTLTPFKSPFDHYMRGDRNALTLSQQRGFNLFMGRAKCGTCHFAPLFNGLLPPDYRTTEYEVLGTPADDSMQNPRPDIDQGRYAFLPFSLFKGAFKTPSVRNAAVTAPYMHNGKFSTLEKVVDFYDKGGGTGLGLKVPGQTLSGKPLHLAQQEKEDIIAFIKSLTDK